VPLKVASPVTVPNELTSLNVQSPVMDAPLLLVALSLKVQFPVMVPALDDVLLKEHAPVIVPVLVPSPSNVQVGSAVENVHDEVLKAHVIPLPTIKFTGLADEKTIDPVILPIGPFVVIV